MKIRDSRISSSCSNFGTCVIGTAESRLRAGRDEPPTHAAFLTFPPDSRLPILLSDPRNVTSFLVGESPFFSRKKIKKTSHLKGGISFTSNRSVINYIDGWLGLRKRLYFKQPVVNYDRCDQLPSTFMDKTLLAVTLVSSQLNPW